MLVRGVDWATGKPRLRGIEGESALELGRVLGLRVLDGRRHCLGYSKVTVNKTTVDGRTPSKENGSAPPAAPLSSTQQLPCPRGSLAERGYQCGSCFAQDDFRLMHDFHRSGIAPEGLRAYLAQPHWLYIASFANGASKVGTASQLRKTIRLSEQGAVAAQYVALADDGRIVRVLEDSISEGLGVPQLVRSANKFASLTETWHLGSVKRHNDQLANTVRDYLRTVVLPGFSVLNEHWELPAQAAGFISSTTPQAYPVALNSGEHGLPLKAVLGSFGLLELAGHSFVVNLAELKGKVIEFGEFVTELPAVQSSLF